MVLDEVETRSVLAEHEHLAAACTFWQRPGLAGLYEALKTFPLAPHFESLDVTIQGGKRERSACRHVPPQRLSGVSVARVEQLGFSHNRRLTRQSLVELSFQVR